MKDREKSSQLANISGLEGVAGTIRDLANRPNDRQIEAIRALRAPVVGVIHSLFTSGNSIIDRSRKFIRTEHPGVAILDQQLQAFAESHTRMEDYTQPLTPLLLPKQGLIWLQAASAMTNAENKLLLTRNLEAARYYSYTWINFLTGQNSSMDPKRTGVLGILDRMQQTTPTPIDIFMNLAEADPSNDPDRYELLMMMIYQGALEAHAFVEAMSFADKTRKQIDKDTRDEVNRSVMKAEAMAKDYKKLDKKLVGGKAGKGQPQVGLEQQLTEVAPQLENPEIRDAIPIGDRPYRKYGQLTIDTERNKRLREQKLNDLKLAESALITARKNATHRTTDLQATYKLVDLLLQRMSFRRELLQTACSDYLGGLVEAIEAEDVQDRANILQQYKEMLTNLPETIGRLVIQQQEEQTTA